MATTGESVVPTPAPHEDCLLVGLAVRLGPTILVLLGVKRLVLNKTLVLLKKTLVPSPRGTRDGDAAPSFGVSL